MLFPGTPFLSRQKNKQTKFNSYFRVIHQSMVLWPQRLLRLTVMHPYSQTVKMFPLPCLLFVTSSLRFSICASSHLLMKHFVIIYSVYLHITGSWEITFSSQKALWQPQREQVWACSFRWMAVVLAYFYDCTCVPSSNVTCLVAALYSFMLLTEKVIFVPCLWWVYTFMIVVTPKRWCFISAVRHFLGDLLTKSRNSK